MQVYTFSTRNRVVGVLAALAILGAGAALLLLGLALLAGVAVVGGVIGTGILAYRLLRGRPAGSLHRPASSSELDPSLEVFAEPRGIDSPSDAVSRSGPNDDPRRIGPA